MNDAPDFTLRYRTSTPPRGADGRCMERVLRGRLTTPVDSLRPVPVVIVAHGYTSFMDWGFFPRLAERLAGVGIACLRFNFSGSGIGADLSTMTEPQTFARNSYLHELEDLDLIRARLHAGHWPELDPARCGILGHSRGGAMSLIHAKEAADYQAVVTWAAMDRILNFTAERLEEWEREGSLRVMHWTAMRRLPLDVSTLHAARDHRERLDIVAACAALTCEVLLIGGDLDRSVPIAAAQNLANARGEGGRLLRIEGGDHTFGAKHPLSEPLPDTLLLALDATVEHFVANLGPI